MWPHLPSVLSSTTSPKSSDLADPLAAHGLNSWTAQHSPSLNPSMTLPARFARTTPTFASTTTQSSPPSWGFSLLTNHFFIIIILGLLAAWLFLYLFHPSEPPLVILWRTFSEHETLCLLIVSSIAVIFVTSVRSVLISALLLGTTVVSIHGAIGTQGDLFLDE
ncbi:hypothetical protein L1987_30570 [Smallanthus sonchifolius]|uniref:Uncharacterized protein n=1 Tax=Smallanthus sonchifolius TaxID=185202 RepID=A0ACB9I3Z3_9ASTR|nr:hypothetical protein L1987_30570 [Smallanthus sonchifolius]